MGSIRGQRTTAGIEETRRADLINIVFSHTTGWRTASKQEEEGGWRSTARGHVLSESQRRGTEEGGCTFWLIRVF